MTTLQKPKFLVLLQGLMLYETTRVIGVAFLLGLSQGLFPASFAIPAGVGDVLIGITAPLVVLAIRRGALLAWGAALVWNTLGIADLIVAVSEGSISGATTVVTYPWALIPTVAVPIAITLHIVSIALLMRRSVRTYFAQKDSGPGRN